MTRRPNHRTLPEPHRRRLQGRVTQSWYQAAASDRVLCRNRPGVGLGRFCRRVPGRGGATSATYGESGGGKTFFTLDLALHVAAGMPWRGREVDLRGVLYLALEGSHGIRNRGAAFKQANALNAVELPSRSFRSRSTCSIRTVTWFA
ncbi:helicase RepA family protein [Gemmata massiliana]|uniref:helicase RepA family protein n=1 Tax=Gemmata massiliana TaxID=1210884 RepID=UPI0021BCF505|nr:helicase RepA family protein [Gemmata massiliana]